MSCANIVGTCHTGFRALAHEGRTLAVVLAALFLPVRGCWANSGGETSRALLGRQHVAPLYLPPPELLVEDDSNLK